MKNSIFHKLLEAVEGYLRNINLKDCLSCIVYQTAESNKNEKHLSLVISVSSESQKVIKALILFPLFSLSPSTLSFSQVLYTHVVPLLYSVRGFGAILYL